MFFAPPNARILHNTCPQKFSPNLGGARAAVPPPVSYVYATWFTTAVTVWTTGPWYTLLQANQNDLSHLWHTLLHVTLLLERYKRTNTIPQSTHGSVNSLWGWPLQYIIHIPRHSWISYAQYTLPTPKRLNSTVESRRRCYWALHRSISLIPLQTRETLSSV